MSIFDAIRIYLPKKWQEKSVRDFSAEEIDAISSYEITEGDYGPALCMLLVSGGKGFIPLEKDCKLCPGDSIDLKSAKIVTLEKEGEKDIYRIRYEK